MIGEHYDENITDVEILGEAFKHARVTHFTDVVVISREDWNEIKKKITAMANADKGIQLPTPARDPLYSIDDVLYVTKGCKVP